MNELFSGAVVICLAALALAAFFVVLGALFPDRLARTRAIAARAPGRAFVIGLINAFFAGVVVLALLAVASWTTIQLIAVPALVLLSLLALGLAFGLGGVVALLGERLLPERGVIVRHGATAILLALACALPYAGWFLLGPYVALLGLGAFLLTFFEPGTPAV
ncbi:MAG: hypothetical protein IT317_19335 [Anaerolineales bacterium]|nr:hypothetical protein [Anaerolineales bacterium]